MCIYAYTIVYVCLYISIYIYIYIYNLAWIMMIIMMITNANSSNTNMFICCFVVVVYCV